MKRNLTKLFLLLIGVAAPFLILGASANHIAGAELTYISVAPNVFIVQVKVYRDCSITHNLSNIYLNLRSTSCGTSRNVSATKLSNTRILSPYCDANANVCSVNGPLNFEEQFYTATVTFSATEVLCQNWEFSTHDCSRPVAANLARRGCIYVDAYLNLKAGINNNSPVFAADLVPFINVNEPVTYSNHAIDPDGDSLVYSLQPALNSGGLSAPYASGFSATSPLPASTPISLDAHNGSITFTPNLYVPNQPDANHYVMAVQVEDYRKIQGVWEKVGAVRRDMGVRIVANSSNNNPNITIPVVNGQGVLPNQVINLRPGTTMNFQVDALDNNAGDVVTLTSDAADVLPGAVFTSTGSLVNITWTPTTADVRDQLYYFHVTAEDNACAVKGHQTKTYAVRVSNTGGVTGISKEVTAQPGFTAYPNPFSAEITFKVKQTQPHQQILIYNVLGQQIDQITLKGQLHTEQEVVWENASKFPAGQYVARFNNGNGQSLKINKLQ